MLLRIQLPKIESILNLLQAFALTVIASTLFAQASIAVNVNAQTIQFSAANFTVSEGASRVTITVTRTGDASMAATVEFSSGNNAYAQCNNINNMAAQNCDFTVAAGRLTFAANDTSETFTVLIAEDAYVEGDETFPITLSNPTGATLGDPGTATVTITDNDATGAPSVAQKQFIATLTGAQEVPPTGNTIKGNTGFVKLNANETEAGVSLAFSGLTGNQTGAHIHGPASAGTNAGILFQLPLGTPVNNVQINPSAQRVADLKAALHYTTLTYTAPVSRMVKFAANCCGTRSKRLRFLSLSTTWIFIAAQRSMIWGDSRIGYLRSIAATRMLSVYASGVSEFPTPSSSKVSFTRPRVSSIACIALPLAILSRFLIPTWVIQMGRSIRAQIFT
ncbi:MAG TPA: CHRD domain-containing protein [Pyrinomonadaceae bacterium]|nr:CHRD domain-containing protein [Pyrinomonadaceae bacterium]